MPRMEPDRIAWLIVALTGVVAGIGMLTVRPDTAETGRLSTLWPIARLFNHRGVRIMVAVLAFVVAAVGAAGLMGVIG